MTVWQRLRDLREDHDLSQAEVGKVIGCGQSYYGKYERGEVMMGIDKYILLAQYYNVSIDYLTGQIAMPEPLLRGSKPQKRQNGCAVSLQDESGGVSERRLTPRQLALLRAFLDLL